MGIVASRYWMRLVHGAHLHSIPCIMTSQGRPELALDLLSRVPSLIFCPLQNKKSALFPQHLEEVILNAGPPRREICSGWRQSELNRVNLLGAFSGASFGTKVSRTAEVRTMQYATLSGFGLLLRVCGLRVEHQMFQ